MKARIYHDRGRNERNGARGKSPKEHACSNENNLSEMGKKVCPRLRDPTSDRGGEFTQPRTNDFGKLCNMASDF